MHLRSAVLLLMLLVGVLVPVSGAYTPWEVEQASGEELRLLARRAGLDEYNDPEVLREELFALFGEPPEPPEKTAGALEILRADAVSSLVDGQRQLLMFRGGVELLLHDEQPVSLTADVVLLNQTKNMLYAYGTVRSQEGQLIPAESFQADSVILSLEEHTGAALKATAVFLREGDRFYLDGDAVTLRSGDDIIIDQGVLSTRAEDPYFSIRASRLHLLPSGDITLRGASLYLGRVPVLWLPYFYYPSRTFVFNPVVGFDSQRGYFSQNTLYLSGAPEARKGEDANLFRFFLEQDDEQGSPVSDWYSRTYRTEPNGATEGFSRLMVDVYSGNDTEPAEVFTGFELFDPDPSWLNRFSFKGGVSFGARRQAEELPFGYERYGGFFDLQARYRLGEFSADLQLPYMTQREFTRDFLNRFEHFSFQHLFDDQTEWPGEYREPTSLLWKLDTSVTYRNSSTSLIEQLQVTELSGALSWRLTDTDEIRHFDPYTVTAPRLSYRITGTIFDIEGSSTADDQHETEDVPEVPALYAADIPVPLSVFETEDSRELENLRSDRSIPEVQSPRVSPATQLSMSYAMDHDASLNIPLQEDDPFDFARITSRLNHTLNTQLKGAGGMIAGSSALRTRLHYYDHPFGETESADRYSTYLSLLHDLQVSVPAAQVTYRLDTELFHDRFLFADETLRNRRTLAWDDTQVKRHELFHDRSYVLNEAGDALEARLTLRLPPLVVSLAPRLTYTKGDFSVRGETWFSWNEQLDVLESSVFAQYRRDADRLISQRLEVDHEENEWEGESRLNLKFGELVTSQQLLTGNTQPHHNLGPYRITAEYHDSSFRVVNDWIDEGNTYAPAQLRLSHQQNLPDLTFWKDRIRFTSGVTADLMVDRQQEFQDRFRLSADAGFIIEEFLDIRFRSASYHRNPRKYLDDPGAFVPDLLDSFGTLEDRRRSPFNIDAYEVELVHYMPDWNLHASLSGGVERAGNDWNLEHRLHVYLQWKHIPELRTDHRSEF